MLEMSSCHGNCDTCSVVRTVIDTRGQEDITSVMSLQKSVEQQDETLPAVVELPVVYSVSKKRNGLVGKLVGGK